MRFSKKKSGDFMGAGRRVIHNSYINVKRKVIETRKRSAIFLHKTISTASYHFHIFFNI